MTELQADTRGNSTEKKGHKPHGEAAPVQGANCHGHDRGHSRKQESLAPWPCLVQPPHGLTDRPQPHGHCTRRCGCGPPNPRAPAGAVPLPQPDSMAVALRTTILPGARRKKSRTIAQAIMPSGMTETIRLTACCYVCVSNISTLPSTPQRRPDNDLQCQSTSAAALQCRHCFAPRNSFCSHSGHRYRASSANTHCSVPWVRL